jgi:hypothetical protein
MSEIDPSQRCWVHELLNKVAFAWDPERADWERLSRTDCTVLASSIEMA